MSKFLPSKAAVDAGNPSSWVPSAWFSDQASADENTSADENKSKSSSRLRKEGYNSGELSGEHLVGFESQADEEGMSKSSLGRTLQSFFTGGSTKATYDDSFSSPEEVAFLSN